MMIADWPICQVKQTITGTQTQSAACPVRQTMTPLVYSFFSSLISAGLSGSKNLATCGRSTLCLPKKELILPLIEIMKLPSHSGAGQQSLTVVLC